MRAIVVHNPMDLRIEEQDVAEPGIGEVHVAVAAGGICGSDLHYYQHGGFGTVRLKEPMVLGHEVSGHVAKLGGGVETLAVGDLVAVSPSRPCGSCQYCGQGLKNQCENMRFYGSAMPFPHIQGAFRETLLADASQCVKADGLTAGEAAMAEPLSVGLHAVRRAGDVLGKRVLVTGCGPIGALVIAAARAAGAAEIVATDVADNALATARTVGAERTINVMSEPEALDAYGAGKGTFDVHIECSGTVQALTAGIAAVRPRGVIVQLGMGGAVELPLLPITVKELDLRGSFRFHEEFAVAVKLMQLGQIDVKPVISHTLPLDEAVAAFTLAGDRSQAMKTQISFS